MLIILIEIHITSKIPEKKVREGITDKVLQMYYTNVLLQMYYYTQEILINKWTNKTKIGVNKGAIIKGSYD